MRYTYTLEKDLKIVHCIKIVNNYNTQLKSFIFFKAESDPGLT